MESAMGSLKVHYEDVWFWHHWSEIFAKTPRRTSILATTGDFHKLFSIDLLSMADPKALQCKYSQFMQQFMQESYIVIFPLVYHPW